MVAAFGWGISWAMKRNEALSGMNESNCRNCREALAGEFCASCGQRRFRAQDRRLGHLLGEALGALTDFDSRIWRRLRASLLQPGRIERDWIDGARARWISPIRLFLLANLLYFLAPAMTDFSLPFSSQVRGEIWRDYAPESCTDEYPCDWGGQTHSVLTEPWLRARLDAEKARAAGEGTSFSLRDFAQRYNARSESIGKLLVILHVPFVALVLALVAWRSRRFYAEHFVVALGMMTFVLLFVQVVVKPSEWLYRAIRGAAGLPGDMPALALWFMLAVFIWYFVVCCRRSYQSAWWLAFVQGLLAMLAFIMTSLVIYRGVQFVLALWTM